jgi:hypothetical protein
MRKPMTVRPSFQLFGLLVAAATLLSACTADTSTAPVAPEHSILNVSAPLASKGGSMNTLDGVPDGVYTVTLDPTRDQDVALGKSRIVIPANAVCDLATSGYGIGMWDRPCAPQKDPVTLTITMSNSGKANAHIDFEPAMRFNPTKDVELFIYTEKANKHDAKSWVMLYCPTVKLFYGSNGCFDESRFDSDLKSDVDKSTSSVFRRIKHFSGYVIAGRDGDSIDSSDSF